MAELSIALIANGEIKDKELTAKKIASYPYIIAVDGGLDHCLKMKIRPSLIIGDLDSATKESLNFFSDVEKKTFPKDKDQTDLEIALSHAFTLNPAKMTVFGALGGRTDHILGNIILLSRFKGKLHFESATEHLFVIDQEISLTCLMNQTLSLIPLNGPVTGVTTHGLKWELKDATLDKHFLGISNVALSSQVTIRIENGDLLCCLQS